MKRADFTAALRKLADQIDSGDSLEGRVRYMLADEPAEVRADIMVRQGNLDGQGSWFMYDEIRDGNAHVSLAQRVHDSDRRESQLESELLAAVQAACGELATGDDAEFTTDGYDNSIEVYGVGAIDLDAAALTLHGHGFARVWLHQHLAPRGNCTCRCR